MPQPQPWQQFGFNEMQQFQQHAMLKRLQELQTQQQIQQFGDVKQQNSANQISSMAGQTSGIQFPLINGAPVEDASQLFGHWRQHSVSPSSQGSSQTRLPQQVNGSPYGTPIIPHSHIQNTSDGHANTSLQYDNPVQKPIIQSSGSRNLFMSDQNSPYPSQPSVPTQGYNTFDQAFRGLTGKILSDNFHQKKSSRRDVSAEEFSWRDVQSASHEPEPDKSKPYNHSQSSVPLDPLEEKLLYSMDDNIWDTSFGSQTELGSWSALMQSALEESSGTGLQDNWNGLNSQNASLAAEDQTLNFVGSEKHQADIVIQNLQTISSASSMQNISNSSSSFPGFHQISNNIYSNEQEGPREDSNKYIQQASKSGGTSGSIHQQSSLGGDGQVQLSAPLEHGWSGQSYQHSQGEVHQHNLSPYDQHRNEPYFRPTNQVHPDAHYTSINAEEMEPNTFSSVQDSRTSRADVEPHKISKSVPSYPKHVDLATKHRDNESMDSVQYEPAAGPQVMQNSYDVEGKVYNMQQSGNPENSTVLLHTSTGHNVEKSVWPNLHGSQPLIAGYHKSSNQGHSTQVEDNSKASNVISEGSRTNILTSFGNASPVHRSNITIQESQHMFEFLQKINQLREDNVIPRQGFNHPLTQPLESGTSDASQPLSQTTSQGHDFRLVLPSRNPQISQSSTLMGVPPRAYTSSPPYLQSQIHLQSMPNAPATFQSSKETLHGMASRFSRHTPSQNTPVPVRMDSFDLQNSLKPLNAWTCVPGQRHSPVAELEKDPPKDVCIENVKNASLTQQDLMDDPQASGKKSSELVTAVSAEECKYGEGRSAEHTLPSVSDSVLNPAGMSQGQDSMGYLPGSSDKVSGSSLVCFDQQHVNMAGDSYQAQNLSIPVFRNPPSHGMVTFNQNHLQGPSSRAGLPQISMQMANSWFKLYGSMKNGQISDAMNSKITSYEDLLKHDSGQQVNASDAGSGQSVWPSKPVTLVANEFSSPHYALTLDRIDQSLGASRPKKRKAAISDLLPWHKEVIQCSERLDISTAEQDWARSTFRLMEKVGTEAELLEDGNPMAKAKKRLALTTQLVQQLLRSTTAAVLSTDTSGSSSVAYFVARLALGDACALVSCQENSNMSCKKLKGFEGSAEQDIPKIVNEFADQIKNLQNYFLSLDERPSFVDVRVEWQELEKFSIMNRFAKVYSRLQTSATDASSNGPQKIYPQRYVTAVPMPKNVPEGLQCLLL